MAVARAVARAVQRALLAEAAPRRVLRGRLGLLLVLGLLPALGLLSLLGGCKGEKIIYVEDPSLAPGAQTGAGTQAPAPTPAAPAIRISGWHPTWSGQGGRDSIGWAGDAMDEVNPTWYSVLADGSLKKSRSIDAQYVADMHGRGYEVAPMIDDFQSGRPSRVVMASASIRATHIQAILAEVDAFGYDGIDIDYERLRSSNRAGFTAFMTDLSAALHSRGKFLSAAVWSKTSEPGTGVRGSQDWPALGQVVDRFKIMTYGYGWSGGPARAIGPVWRAERILRFAVSVMDPARVYYAIPFYGYRWPDNGQRAKSVTYQSAESLRRRYGATSIFDASQGEATFSYTDSAGVSWTCWYQTPEAIQAKVDLAKLVGIGGVAIWRLGGESSGFWDVIRQAR